MKLIPALAVVAAVAAAASACGAPAPRAHGPQAHGPQAYAGCMRAHGVRRFPDPVDGRVILTPGSGVNPASPGFQAAARACAALAPPASGSGGGPGRPGASLAQWRGFGRWLRRLAAAGQFSGAVLVARQGSAVLDAGYGLADRADGRPDTQATRFCIASIGKLFTAVAVAQLAEQHKLSFGDPVGRFLRGFPAATARVTVGDLLDMTSGLGNVVLGRARPPATLAAMIRLIAAERLQFRPGSRFGYSNDGYIVLGAIIARVSGESYPRYLARHVLGPAGMTSTSVTPYIPADVPGMAHGYALGGGRLRDISGLRQVANPSGGAWSTTGDLLRFARALLGRRLLSPAMTARILVPRVDSPQPGGPPVDEYTYGFACQRLGGVTFVGHNGGTPGYAGQVDIYPAAGYVVVILTNQDDVLVPAIQRSEAIVTRNVTGK